jgi:arylsulfatase A
MPSTFRVGLSALALIAGLAGPTRAAGPPNVILIITDDQGWAEVGVHGNRDIETPNLDRLAAEGVRFARFYAEPVCTPTRAELMTGRYYQRTGAVDTFMGRDTLDAREVTLAERLRRAGYATGLIGKWHLGRYMRYHPTRRGFDDFFGFWQYGFINHYFDSEELFRGREPVKTTGYVTDVLTDAAIDFVRAHRDGPFFLDLAYNAPHDPHLAPDPLIEMYLGKGLPLRDARIYGMITSLDRNIGRLLGEVDALGLRGRTVVLFLSDNGGVSDRYKAGLRGKKGSVHEGGIRVPLFVRWPGHAPAGSVVEARAEVVDLFPTICELAVAAPPDDRTIDGRSLVPLIEGRGGPALREHLFRQWTRVRPDADRNWAASDGRYKLVDGELFDLEADPGETTDLAARHPEIVRRLRSAFERWFADVTAGRDYGRVPIEVGRDDEDPVELDVTWAEAVGRKLRPTHRRYNRDAVLGWSEPGDSVRWGVDVVRAGRYEVVLDYGCRDADAGSRFRVAAAGASLDGMVEGSGGRDVFRPRDVGAIALPAGRASFEIHPLRIVGEELMTLHKVWLRKLP